MSKIYKDVTEQDLCINTLIPVKAFEDIEINVTSKLMVKFSYLSGGLDIVCTKGYAWDYCTPKFKTFGKIWGVWDGPIVEKAYTEFYDNNTGKDIIWCSKPQLAAPSLVHDILCQFSKELSDIGVTQKQIDEEFLRRMAYAKVNPVMSLSYYFAVRGYQTITSLF